NCRRQQKKNQGRWRELGRKTSKAALNLKRGAAQQSQARVANIRQERIASMRSLVKTSRRVLDVVLPMELVMPELPPMDGSLTVDLENVGKAGLFSDLTLKIKRERIAVVGPNGSGKSTLLNIVMQNIAADEGSVAIVRDKVGYIAQGGSNWMLAQSLVEHMLHLSQDMTPQRVMELLIAFKFPLALAERDMSSLTPGERTRAALLCLMVKQPYVECLVLDEPSNGLDFLAAKALQQSLKAWTGGFIIAGHDQQFFEQIGVDRVIGL
ncbi:MAG: ATP-binding cassette domain-containing protein, partial [Psychrosphaera sp.]|nr:ATP-binding cassette domain-containing protein [Psychrosphaera sp.]